MGRVAHSVLAVPVPALEEWVRGRHEHYDRDYVSADPSFAHAHITVLAPWLADPTAEDLARVGEIASATTAFDFRLELVETFPNGIIHLVPEPKQPFARLTRALWRAFPQCPPYQGRFGEVRAHLTLDAVGPGVSEQVVREWLRPLVPVVTHADRLHLSWYAAGDCRTLAAWPLRAGAVRPAAASGGPGR